jgi:hypothetical protein
MKGPNNRINPDWQLRCAPLPAGYAEHSLIEILLDTTSRYSYIITTWFTR